MADVILNLLSVTEEEKNDFETIAPEAEHIYAETDTVKPEDLARATVMFGWPRPESMKNAVNLRWFQTQWAGSDEYQAPGVLPEHVVLTCSGGANARSVAEHMLASTLALCRRLPRYRDMQREHIWADESETRTLLGADVLVAGTGHVGAAYGKLCQALGARTTGLKRTVTKVDGFDRVCSMEELDRLLPQADVVALVLPHTPETAGLMDSRRIALMKDDAMLISDGRGSVLDQEALAGAMKSGKLWGAALDVTCPEPLPEESPLWDIPNLLLTPHVAGGMRLEITRKACVRLAQENLRRYLAGRPLENRVR